MRDAQVKEETAGVPRLVVPSHYRCVAQSRVHPGPAVRRPVLRQQHQQRSSPAQRTGTVQQVVQS